VTLGPRGRNVVYPDPEAIGELPKITKDGVSVARQVNLSRPVENIGVKLFRDVAEQVNESCGDGTTTSTVLAEAIFGRGKQSVLNGVNPLQLRRSIQYHADLLVKELGKLSKPVTSLEQIEQIATISLNDSEMAKLITSVYRTLGPDAIISIEEGTSTESKVTYTEGISIEKGFISPYFATDRDRTVCDMKQPLVLITNSKVSHISEIVRILEYVKV
jgi:chaperonin GroEL